MNYLSKGTKLKLLFEPKQEPNLSKGDIVTIDYFSINLDNKNISLSFLEDNIYLNYTWNKENFEIVGQTFATNL